MIREALQNIDEAMKSVIIRKFKGSGNPKYKGTPGYLHVAIFDDAQVRDKEFIPAWDMDIGDQANLDIPGIKNDTTPVDYNSADVKAFVKELEAEEGKVKLVKDRYK